MRRVSFLSVIPFLLLAVACTQSERHGPVAPFALQDSCETLLQAQVPAKIHVVADPESTRWTMRPDEPIKQVLGFRWHGASHTLTLYDGVDGRLLTFDTTGHLVGQLLRGGEGPGELHQGWGAPGHPPRSLYLSEDGSGLVLDPQRLSRFTSGMRYADRRTFMPTAGWAMREMNVDGWDDNGAVFSTTGRWISGTTDSAVRERLTLERIDLGTGRSREVAILRNTLAYLGYDSLPGARHTDQVWGSVPFDRLFGRTWDVEQGRLSFISWNGYGVCTMRIADRTLVGYRVRAIAPPVDREEREWAMRLDVVDPDARLPVGNATLREAYRDLWPAREPYYLDVLQGTDGEVWALRRTPERTFVTDRFTAERGYVGTFSVGSFTDMPMQLVDGQALHRFQDGDDETWYAMRAVAPPDTGLTQ